MAVNIAMPIGVPIPSVDFTQALPARPADWSAEVPGYYYVDSRVSNDTDTYGTPTVPIRNIPNPVPAGSFIVIRGPFNYSSGGASKVNSAGTDVPWVANTAGWVFLDFGKDEPDVDRGTILFDLLIYGSNVLIDGARCDLNKTIKIGSSTAGFAVSNAVVRNCKMVGLENSSSTSALNVNSPYDVGGSTARNVVVYNNTITGYGPYASASDVDANGIVVRGDTTDVWILYNTVWFMSGGGIQLAASDGTTTHTDRIYVGKNHIYDCAQAGFANKYAVNVVVSQNTIHDIPDRPWTPSKAIGFQYAPQNTWVLFNEIYNCRHGVRGAGTNSTGAPVNGWAIMMIGNIIHDINEASPQYSYDIFDAGAGSAAITQSGTGNYDWYCANNVIWNCETGFTSGRSASNVVLENNVFVNCDHKVLNLESSSMVKSIDNNIFPVTGFAHRITGTPALDTSWATFETAFGTTNVQVDYGNVASFDAAAMETLIAGHVSVIDNGIDMPTVLTDLYLSTFGIAFNHGLLDKTIPQGVSRDIGPWEDGSLYQAVFPTAPSAIELNATTGQLTWVLNSSNETSIKVYEDTVEIANLANGVVTHTVAAPATAEHNYYVTVTNTVGTAISDGIDTVLMTASVLPDSLSIDASNTGSYLLARSSAYNDVGPIKIGVPVYNNGFGIDSSEVLLSVETVSVADGFNYVIHDGSEITVDLTGTGKVDISVAMNSYEGVATSRVYVGGTFVEMTCAEGNLAKHNCLLTMAANASLVIKPVSVNGKHASGMIAIRENLFFIAAVVTNLSVAFTNPVGYTGTWDFGDTNTTTNVDPTHVYASASSFNVTFTDDATSNVALYTAVTVDPNILPTLAVAVDVTNQLVIDFSANAVDSDGVIANATYLWDFGDGSGTSTLENPQYTFPNPGVALDPAGQNFTVQCTVTDEDGGSAVDSIAITVYDFVPVSLGAEILLNPDFDNMDDSDFSPSSSITYTGLGTGTLRIAATSTSSDRLDVKVTLVVGKNYRLSYRAQEITTTTSRLNNFVGTVASPNEFHSNVMTDYTYDFEASATAVTMRIYVVISGGVSGDSMDLERVSLKEIL